MTSMLPLLHQNIPLHVTLFYFLTHYAIPEKIPRPTHNASLPMGYFVQVVMWVVSDKTYLKCKIIKTSVH